MGEKECNQAAIARSKVAVPASPFVSFPHLSLASEGFAGGGAGGCSKAATWGGGGGGWLFGCGGVFGAGVECYWITVVLLGGSRRPQR
jgi:hypothetical protein